MFRRYQHADHDAVWSVFVACTEQLGFAWGPWDQDMHAIPDFYLAAGDFIVGEMDGRIIAFGGLLPETNVRVEVRRVGVHPAMQRRGVGHALMAELAARAVAMGFTSLYLDTSVTQVAAQRLYLSCGYQEIGHVVKSGIECILYQKDLADASSSV